MCTTHNVGEQNTFFFSVPLQLIHSFLFSWKNPSGTTRRTTAVDHVFYIFFNKAYGHTVGCYCTISTSFMVTAFVIPWPPIFPTSHTQTLSWLEHSVTPFFCHARMHAICVGPPFRTPAFSLSRFTSFRTYNSQQSHTVKKKPLQNLGKSLPEKWSYLPFCKSVTYSTSSVPIRSPIRRSENI